MDDPALAAMMRFPDRRSIIESLSRRDEGFRSLCADLAEAEAALVRWQASSSSVKDARCEEYAALIESLAAEIEAKIGE